MRLVFAAKTALWFKKFPLGHLEVFPEKMKMPKTWSKFFSSIAPSMEGILESRMYIYLVTWRRGYVNATDSAFVTVLDDNFPLILLLILCTVVVNHPTFLLFSILLLILRRKGT